MRPSNADRIRSQPLNPAPWSGQAWILKTRDVLCALGAWLSKHVNPP